MGDAVTCQCPNCNGILTFDAMSGKPVCEHCGSVFEELSEKYISIPVGTASRRQATEHVKDVEGFLNRTIWGGASAGELVGAMHYSCPSCGASITADQSIVSTSCPYCGNNMLLTGIATEANVPQKILPFSVTREQAEEKMKEHFLHKWYLSRRFNASLEHMQGVYVPYHLYDMEVDGRADYIGYNHISNSKGQDIYYYYAIQRSGHASFEQIPVDGASKIPDGHMDAIAPFSLEGLQEFSAGYVTEYLMEVPDETPEQCYHRAEERARNSFEDDLEADASQEKKIDGIEKTVRHYTIVNCKNVTTCVLPVWLTHCTWDDVQMLFAINGETGKCIGDLPVDSQRRGATLIGTALIALFASMFIMIALASGDVDGYDLGKFAIGALIVSFFAILLVDRHFMGQMQTAVETTHAYMSYDSQGLIVTHRWRSRKGYATPDKAAKTLDFGEKEGLFRGKEQPLPWDAPNSIWAS